jgi:hypothetical protein
MNEMLLSAIRMIVAGLAAVAGVTLIAGTLLSAIRTFVLPRSAPDRLTRLVFRRMRAIFSLRLKRVETYEAVDRILALYAPLTLCVLPFVWLFLVWIGYGLIFWAVDFHPAEIASYSLEAFLFDLRVSGSSLLTLGFVAVDSFPLALISFLAASTGLVLVALLIAYLPTIYSAFSKREALVTMLEVRAGSPFSPTQFFQRMYVYAGVEELELLWKSWEVWFTELEESHTSLPPLAFFRSQQPNRSWITAAGIILDAAALSLAVLDMPRRSLQAALTIRAGFLALQRIASFFGIPYNPDPHYPDDSISVTRAEFDALCDELAADPALKLKADRDQAWIDYAGWRVNYDRVLVELCGLVVAPYSPWSSDRGVLRHTNLFEPAPHMTTPTRTSTRTQDMLKVDP